MSIRGELCCRPKHDSMISSDEIDRLREEKEPFFLDVRKQSEIQESGTLPGYYHIPIDELEGRMNEIPKERLILTA
jgi:rhodanese-related sulfurtransferase